MGNHSYHTSGCVLLSKVRYRRKPRKAGRALRPHAAWFSDEERLSKDERLADLHETKHRAGGQEDSYRGGTIDRCQREVGGTVSLHLLTVYQGEGGEKL